MILYRIITLFSEECEEQSNYSNIFQCDLERMVGSSLIFKKETHSSNKNGRREGLLIVREEKKDAAIIFVHGIGGDPYSTWKKKNSDSLPHLLMKDAAFTRFDLYTFGYKTGFLFKRHNFKKISDLLITEMKVRLNHKEIYFIAHSMGGVVVQRMLIEQVERRTDNFIHNIRGIVYLAVPFAGSNLASIASKTYALIPPFVGEYVFSVQVRSLKIFSDELAEQSVKWFRYTGDRLSHVRQKNIYGQSDRTVASASSNAPYIEDMDVVEENHRSICKIDQKHTVYHLITNYFKQISDEKEKQKLEDLKLLKEQFGISKEAIRTTMEKWKAYKQELYSNSTLFFKMESILQNVLYESPSSFEAIEVAIRLIRRGSWTIFKETEADIVISINKKLAAISFETQLDMSFLNIQTSIAEWKRQYEIRDKIGELQIINIFNETKLHIESLILAVIWKMEDFEELDVKLDDKELFEEIHT